MSKPNDTSTGGFLKPNPQPPVLVTTPPGLTFIQFLQQVFVGLSGFPGPLVRPEWQQNPPKHPDIDVDWMAFGLGEAEANFNGYVGYDANNNPVSERVELIPVSVSVYGPNSYDNMGLIRDGLQLTQNLSSLKQANVAFAYETTARHVPDLVNERWFDRWRIDFYFWRALNRTYPILTFLSATGTINAEVATTENYQLPWTATGR